MNTTQIVINALFILFLLINIVVSFMCIFYLAEKEEDKVGCVLVSGLFGGYAIICTVIFIQLIVLFFNN